MRGDPRQRHMRLVGGIGLHVAGARKAHEVAVAALARREQDHLAPALAVRRRPARRRLMVAEIDADLQADDGLDALLRCLLRKLERAEEVVGVGQRQRRHAVGLRQLGQHGDRQGPFQQREGGVGVEMNEAHVSVDGGHAMLRLRPEPPSRVLHRFRPGVPRQDRRRPSKLWAAPRDPLKLRPRPRSRPSSGTGRWWRVRRHPRQDGVAWQILVLSLFLFSFCSQLKRRRSGPDDDSRYS